MTATLVVVAAIVLAAGSGVPALFLSRTSTGGQRLSAGILAAASALGITGAAAALGGRAGAGLVLRGVAGVPAVSLHVDPLSAVFLLPVFLLAGCAAAYGLAYWPQRRHQRNGRSVGLFLGLLTAGLAGVLVARDGIAFLFGWEVMALSCFFLVAAEDRRAEVRAAAWIYLAATHVATLVLFAFFALLHASTGSFALAPLPPGAIPPGRADALFVLALAGFGLKAGIVPLHFWLPPAHANAPSHVSAIMSGVLIKVGVYGVARTCSILPEPPSWWGDALLAAGATSAFVGVAFAIGQHDLKRLLAYHSIENIGIIFLGLGLAMAGRAAQRPDWIVLGMGGALLHVWNHALFKALLFFAAGATIRRAGTRAIDRMGGIGKAMPLTAACFLVGAVAICGLPPLNGFVSELIVYLGLFAAAGGDAANALVPLAVPVLAMVGAMALICFVKVFSAVYLGRPRSDAVARARESEPAILAPMGVLVAGCAAVGLLPVVVVPLLDPAIATFAPGAASLPGLRDRTPVAALSVLGPALLVVTVAAGAWLFRRGPAARTGIGTWACGYALPAPAAQYTASSFAQPFVQLLRWLLRPSVQAPPPPDLFPGPARFHSSVPDLVLDRVLLPALHGFGQACAWLRHLHGGRVHLYLLYMFLTLLVLLLVR